MALLTFRGRLAAAPLTLVDALRVRLDGDAFRGRLAAAPLTHMANNTPALLDFLSAAVWPRPH